MKQLALDIVSPPQPTLANFLAGRNGELLQNLRQFAARQASERFLYVWGCPGSGRSHLLRGVVADLQAAGTAAAYVVCEAGTRLADELAYMDCVALDDVDRLDDEGQRIAFGFYNALRERKGVLVAGGAAPPVQLKLREDLVTRLAWGLVYEVHALTDDEKIRALQDHAVARGIRLPEEVCAFLLTRVQRDMGTLLAVLDALDRSSLAAKRAITVPFLREWLQAAKDQDPGSRIQDSESRMDGSGLRIEN